ncbi:MAG: ABC transporter ATP-binding protein [Phycisphaerae bacterium]|nr:ABC transporter ATP-binding protein [Phycisphaerae bacterium]
MIHPAAQADPGSSDTVIQFDDVFKIYQMGSNEVRALDGVSISFHRGEFWSIMGPSGSGKSTMLNLLGCLDRPTAGRCLIDQHDVAGLEDDQLSDIRLRRLGFVFQSFNLIPQLTVSENIEMPMSYLGIDADEAADRAAELADMVGLGDRLGHRPTELSGGQQQRVAVARALANDPSILLADEPTGNLDSSTGRQIMELMRELHEQGRTIVMVTHERHVADYSQKQLHMLDGRIGRIEEAGSS